MINGEFIGWELKGKEMRSVIGPSLVERKILSVKN